MRADPRPACGDLAQQADRAPRAFLALMERIDPDEHAIGLQQLRANLVGKLFVIDGRFGMNADRGELLEDAMKAIVGRGRVAPRLAVATPDNRNFGRSHGCFPSSGKGRIVRLSK